MRPVVLAAAARLHSCGAAALSLSPGPEAAGGGLDAAGAAPEGGPGGTTLGPEDVRVGDSGSQQGEWVPLPADGFPSVGGSAAGGAPPAAGVIDSGHLFSMYGDSLGIPDGAERHPPWHFEGWRLSRASSWACCAALVLAGVLCSAGGIGGGGVYVTVLMVAGGLEIGDAVPLSKTVVFIGSFSTLALNLWKKAPTSSGGPAGELIDFNICRVVVPSSLGGTYVGVLLNRILPSWIIALMLTSLLVAICVTLVAKMRSQCAEETGHAKRPAAGPELGVGGASAEAPVPGARHAASEPAAPAAAPQAKAAEAKAKSLQHVVRQEDYALIGSLMVVVIFFSVLRYHAGSCQHSPLANREELCHPTLFRWTGKETFKSLVTTTPTADVIGFTAYFLPLGALIFVVFHYSRLVLTTQGWSVNDTFVYNAMALGTGCVAGLMGIGGGLIFSPFLLLMEVEPAVAVATSSTCVVFTAASTSLQYLLSDRVIVSLAVVYGAVNLGASYVGTKLVHHLQDKHAARKSFISGIVALGVLISTVLAAVKAAESLAEEFGPGRAGPAHGPSHVGVRRGGL